MSPWTVLALLVLTWLILCALATAGASRWAKYMAAKDQAIQLDRELSRE